MKGEMREVLYLEINILPQFITGLLFVTEITEMRRGGGLSRIVFLSGLSSKNISFNFNIFSFLCSFS